MTTSGYTIPYSGPAYSAWGEPLEEYGIAKVENIEAAHDIIIALRGALEDMLETFQYLYTHDDYLKQRNFKNIPAVKHGLAVIGKMRNSEAQP